MIACCTKPCFLTTCGGFIPQNVVRAAGTMEAPRRASSEETWVGAADTGAALDYMERPAADELSSIVTVGRPLRVLIVDDSTLCQRLLSRMLVSRGFTVDTANNGLEGFSKASMHDPCLFDIVIMDVRMPVMDGIASIEKMRKVPCLKKLPILAMSNEVSDEMKAMSAAAGASGFVEKPIKGAMLLAHIVDICSTPARAVACGCES